MFHHRVLNFSQLVKVKINFFVKTEKYNQKRKKKCDSLRIR